MQKAGAFLRQCALLPSIDLGDRRCCPYTHCRCPRSTPVPGVSVPRAETHGQQCHPTARCIAVLLHQDSEAILERGTDAIPEEVRAAASVVNGDVRRGTEAAYPRCKRYVTPHSLLLVSNSDSHISASTPDAQTRSSALLSVSRCCVMLDKNASVFSVRRNSAYVTDNHHSEQYQLKIASQALRA
jgi:hypothetical protein